MAPPQNQFGHTMGLDARLAMGQENFNNLRNQGFGMPRQSPLEEGEHAGDTDDDVMMIDEVDNKGRSSGRRDIGRGRRSRSRSDSRGKKGKRRRTKSRSRSRDRDRRRKRSRSRDQGLGRDRERERKRKREQRRRKQGTKTRRRTERRRDCQRCVRA